MKNDRVITNGRSFKLSIHTRRVDEGTESLLLWMGDKIWGKYGFYDAFSIHHDWYPERYLAIDQLTIAPMIENHRTGLLWDLFMGAPEIQEGLKKLGISYSN